jgi:hypothetical protein
VPLTGIADIVDDHAAACRLHAVVVQTAKVDVAQYLKFPALAPGRLVDRPEIASGNDAGIVDQDVDVTRLFGQFVGSARGCQVHRENLDMGPEVIAKRCGECFEQFSAAGCELQRRTFGSECSRQPLSDALRRPRYQHRLAV